MIFTECDKCKKPFVEVSGISVTIRHRYVYTVQQMKGQDTFEVDQFALCSECSDELYRYLQDNNYRPLVDTNKDGIPDSVYEMIEANPALKELFLKITQRE